MGEKQICVSSQWEDGGRRGSLGRLPALLCGPTCGCAPPECSLSQGESPPSWPSMITSPGLRQTCPSRKESACKSSTTRECPCPCPCSQGHPLSCPPRPSCGAPALQEQLSQGWALREKCQNAHGHSDCPRTLTLEVVICLLPHPPGPAAGHCGFPALSPSHVLCLLAVLCPPAQSHVPIRAQLPLVCLDTSLSFLAAFPCACTLSLISASLLTLLSLSPRCRLGEKWMSGVYSTFLLLL